MDPAAIQGARARAAAPNTTAFRLPIRPAVAAAGAATPGVVGGQLLGTIGLHSLLLTRPTDADVDLSRPVVELGLPRQMARLRLEAPGAAYELFYLDEAADPEYQLRHVTMMVVNEPRGHARFSIEPRTGRVYGHLYTPAATYRFVPSAAANEQFVYRLGATGAGSMLHGAASPEPDALARRHQQIEAIAEIQPTDLWALRVSDKQRMARVVGGKLGVMRGTSAAAFLAAMKRLAVVSQVTGNEVFRIGEITRYGGSNTRITFVQYIDGVPVDGENEVGLDAKGNILYFQTQLFPWDASPVQPNLTQQQAWDRAIAQWQIRHGAKAEHVELDRPHRLYYTAWDDAKRLTLVHEFRFTVPDSGPALYRAQVNAQTGQVDLLDLTLYSDFGHTVCIDTSWSPPGGPRPPKPRPIPTFCGEGGTRVLYSTQPGAQPVTCPGSPGEKPNPCTFTEEQTMTRVMTEVDIRMRESSALNRPETTGSPMPRCCQGIGAPTANIDILSASRFAESFALRNIIYLVPTDKGVETMVHEWAHVYTFTYNDRLIPDGDLFGGALREGLADVVSGLFGEISQDKAKFGDPFVHGDGLDASTTRRDGRVARTFTDIDALGEAHLAGQVISNFFFRLKQASPSTSFQRLLGIALGTLATVRSTGTRTQRLQDFRSAVIGTLNPNTEQQLIAAVIRVFDDMNGRIAGPPGTPGPVGAPAAPTSVGGSFAFCGIFQGSPVSVYRFTWTPVFNSAYYRGYTRISTEPTYRPGDAVLAPQTELAVVTNTNGDARVSACNDVGCSGLSPSNLVVSHLPQCNPF